jgi:alkylation response protein AidB-like acyl-CoA dehydrogenase
MRIQLTSAQEENQAAFRAFANREIVPYADGWDREERTPPEVIGKLASQGYLGALIPVESGGRGMDTISYGLLNEEIGRGCSSLRNLLTVHCMVGQAILKWGTRNQKEHWMTKLAAGDTVAAFGLTEPNVGSDAKSLEATAKLSGDSYILNGHKIWTTYGQVANLFLVFAQCEGRPTAFLVERESPGLSVKPITGMLGVRASMLAELLMTECRIPKENLVGRVGLGISHVASYALDYGRYSVAWGCVGIAQACLEACLRYTNERKQFGVYLKEHQLIQQMMTEMITNLDAARLLCFQAGYLKDTGDPRSIMETTIAKYFASTMVTKVAHDAIQIHGASGCSSLYPVQRYMRDARIMEIVEGSTQIQQMTIAKYGYQYFSASSEAAY